MAARKNKGTNAFEDADLDDLQEKASARQNKESKIVGKTESTPKKKSTRKKKTEVEEEVVVETEPEKTVMVGVRVTLDQKMKLQIYCAKHRTTQERVIRDFIDSMEE